MLKLLTIVLISLLISSAGWSKQRSSGASNSLVQEIVEGDLRVTTEIGQLEGAEEYIFGRVSDAITLGTEVVVLDGQTQDVRVFDREGAFVRRVTSEGEGPGELQQASFLTKVSDDRFVVVEPLRGQGHLFTAQGVFVRTVRFGGRIDRILVADTAGVLYVRPETPAGARLWGGDGRVQLGRMNGLNAAGVEYIGFVRRDELNTTLPGTVLMTLEGEILGTVPSPDLAEPLVSVDTPAGRAIYGFEYQPFSWWTWTSVGRLLVGRTDESEIREVVLPAGQRRVYARLPHRALPVVEADRQAIVDALHGLDDMPESTLHAPPEGWSVKPVYRAVLPSRDGGLWLATYVASVRKEGDGKDDTGWYEPSQEFIVVEADGTVAARVTGPPGITLLFAERGVALGRKVDTLGIHSVVRFEIDWE